MTGDERDLIIRLDQRVADYAAADDAMHQRLEAAMNQHLQDHKQTLLKAEEAKSAAEVVAVQLEMSKRSLRTQRILGWVTLGGILALGVVNVILKVMLG